MAIGIRPATTKDIRQITRLWTELMEFHAEIDPRFAVGRRAAQTFPEFALRLIEGNDTTILTAWDGEEMVGFISVGIQIAPPVLCYDRFGMIHDAAVTTRLRRAGIGEMLFEAARDWLKERDISIVQLSAAPCNPIAMGFWRKMGFHPYLERLWYDIE